MTPAAPTPDLARRLADLRRRNRRSKVKADAMPTLIAQQLAELRRLANRMAGK